MDIASFKYEVVIMQVSHFKFQVPPRIRWIASTLLYGVKKMSHLDYECSVYKHMIVPNYEDFLKQYVPRIEINNTTGSSES